MWYVSRARKLLDSLPSAATVQARFKTFYLLLFREELGIGELRRELVMLLLHELALLVSLRLYFDFFTFIDKCV